MFTCVLPHCVVFQVLVLKLSQILRRGGGKRKPGKGGGAGGLTRETYRGDIFRLMHADKVCPFNGVTMEPEQSL